MKKLVKLFMAAVLTVLSYGNAFATTSEADSVLAAKLVQSPKVSADSVIATSLKATNLDMNTITAGTVNSTERMYTPFLSATKIETKDYIKTKGLQVFKDFTLMPSVNATGEDGSNPKFVMQYGGSSMSNCFSIKFDNDTVTKDLGMIFSTKSYSGFHHITFDASEYNFKFEDGDKTGVMKVDGKIICKSEIRVAEVNTDKVNSKDITAKNINVELGNAADYVFEDGYDLKSLGEVEEYVMSNKHLPGVPSASEFQNKGMNVSEMSNLLLEKVEELTLHLIRMQKEIDQLREENNALKANNK